MNIIQPGKCYILKEKELLKFGLGRNGNQKK